MAINKVVNKSTKAHGAMRNSIEYVLKDKKILDGFVDITGPYNADTLNYDDIYRTWLEEKRLWDKDSGRMYAHNIISFHKDEQITPEQVLEFGRRFAEEFFPDHQCLIGVHQDRDHLHCHILTNSVSYIDGRKLHQTKKDLEKQKEFTNNLCREKGLTVAEKGKHFDGTDIEVGHVTAWSKDKYNLAINASKKPFVVECFAAIEEVRKIAKTVEDFISRMLEKGWTVTWTEKKKHITFQNENGDKVRDSNLSKTFNVDVSKESLEKDFLQNSKAKDKPRTSIRAKLEAAKKQVAEDNKQRKLEAPELDLTKKNRNRNRTER
ncbi:MAG: relaxase/mobilization nuclease domain-containing protein [Lachnospiraceae bacterium]|nr:relaxase/mobilization nuclease domain-containing protein [Lachnospiraceae bacterium]